MSTANYIDISKADKPLAELTDIITSEVSLVDRAANKREFLVKKRADGEAPAINPLLDIDPAIVAKDRAEAEEYRAQKAAQEAGAAPVAPVVTETPAVVTVAAETPAVVEPVATVEEPVVTVVETPVVETPAVAAPVVEKSTETVVAPVPTVDPVKKDDGEESASPLVVSVQIAPATPEPLKIIPQLRSALEAGLSAVIARAQDAMKVLSASVADSQGCSWTPWEISTQTRQIDALVDQMECMGGMDWAASAILAAGAAAAPIDVTKAGAAMSAARHAKFTKAHSDLGSCIKGAQKCHKEMTDMFSSLAPGSSKTEKAEDVVVTPVVAAPIAVEAPVVVAPVPAPAPMAVAPAPMAVAPVAKADPEVETLRKAVEDLRQSVASQAAIIEKAREPRRSNAIPLASTVPNNGTINADGTTWPADLAPVSKNRTNVKF